MADRSLGPHDFASLASHPPAPAPSFVRLYAIGGKLWAKDAAGVQYDLTQAGSGSVQAYSVLTNGDAESPSLVFADGDVIHVPMMEL